MIGHDTAAKAGFGMEVVSHRLTVSAHLRFHAMTISHFVSDLVGKFSRTPFASVANICKMPASQSLSSPASCLTLEHLDQHQINSRPSILKMSLEQIEVAIGIRRLPVLQGIVSVTQALTVLRHPPS